MLYQYDKSVGRIYSAVKEVGLWKAIEQ